MNQPTNQASKQAINQPTNQATKQASKQSISQVEDKDHREKCVKKWVDVSDGQPATSLDFTWFLISFAHKFDEVNSF